MKEIITLIYSYNFIRWRWLEWSRNVQIFNLCDL